MDADETSADAPTLATDEEEQGAAAYGVPPGEAPWAPRHQKPKVEDEENVTTTL